MRLLRRILLLALLLVCIGIAGNTSPGAAQQNGEPRFSYPFAVRYPQSTYFDHTHPDYTEDDDVTIYTAEQGLASNGCVTTISGNSYYWTAPQPDENDCGSGGGRLIGYDGHPAADYDFSWSTGLTTAPVVAAAPGVAYRRDDILGSAVVIDHGDGYCTRYGHVDAASRIESGTTVERGQFIADGSDTGAASPHRHRHALHPQVSR